MLLPSRSRRASRGQALVETAVILPVFLMLLLGVLDMGRAVWATTSLASAAREAARYAIVHGGNSAAVATKQTIMDAAVTAAIAGGSNVTATVCYGPNCSGNVDTLGASNARGQTVTVVVSSNVDLIVPSFVGRSSFNLSGSSTMVVNH
jgi:Flp pilus assembly protein TadG